MFGFRRQNAVLSAKASGLCMVLAAGLLLSACQNKTASLGQDELTTASTSSAAGPSFKRTDALGKQWKSDPTNTTVTLAYAKSLDELGQKPAQIEILRSAATQSRGDVKAQGVLGRAQLSAGDTTGASETLERAVELNPRDAQLRSVLAVTLDQQSKPGQAREHHQAALSMAPDDLTIMNNAAMSFALQGKLAEAETMLRKAAAHPNAKAAPRVRQNLALVVGLQGRFDEAKQIASEDLPPDQVQANMAYLQQMLSRQNTWAQLKEQ